MIERVRESKKYQSEGGVEGKEFEWRGGNRHSVRVTRREKEKCRRIKKEREDRFHGGRRKGVGGAGRGRG